MEEVVVELKTVVDGETGVGGGFNGDLGGATEKDAVCSEVVKIVMRWKNERRKLFTFLRDHFQVFPWKNLLKILKLEAIKSIIKIELLAD